MPLTGIRVIEFATLMSGPFAGLQLAELGCDVFKVEHPDGDTTRKLPPFRNGMSASFYSLNRGKRSVVLDLRSVEGRTIARDLAATADVVIENWRPGVADRLGLAPRALRAANPKLVTVSVRGFGESGPYAQDRVYDSIIQGVSGLAATQSDAGEPPEFVRTYIPDKVAALAVVQGVLASLFKVATTGIGEHISVSMLDATVAFLWPDVLRGLTFAEATAVSDRPHAPRLGALVRSADGRWFCYSAVSDVEWRALCHTLGLDELIVEFATVASRKDSNGGAFRKLEAALAQRTRTEVLSMLRAAGVPSAPVNTPDDLLEDPQVVAGETIQSIDRGSLGLVREPIGLVRIGSEKRRALASAPELGAHTFETLIELGISPERARALATGAQPAQDAATQTSTGSS
jgi:crotonobetainyl-CoA:carnitine CoA-transferase CaiB-like acyl-CoA transferase